MDAAFDLKLVSFLSASETRSGETIASELGCSRTAVWKHIEALRELGISIDAVAGKGYKLVEPLELFDRELILSQIGEKAKNSLNKLVILATTESSNSWLQEKPLSEQAGVFVLAERQTAGRGRRGKKWVSPFGRNIYASLGWEFERGAGDLGCLPLLVALSACDALDALGLRGHSIKWPNDILMNGYKLGGCLVELQGDVNGPCLAVMGIGINVQMPESAPGASAIGQAWTDVCSHVPGVSRNRLAGLLLDSLVSRIEIFSRDGFLPFHQDWKSRDALNGKEVELLLPGSTLKGVALGISDRGGLMLQTEQGVGEYLAGEVSVIKKESGIDEY